MNCFIIIFGKIHLRFKDYSCIAVADGFSSMSCANDGSGTVYKRTACPGVIGKTDFVKFCSKYNLYCYICLIIYLRKDERPLYRPD